MIRALVTLSAYSALNRLWVVLRQLRQPKYLIGVAAFALYMYVFAVRPALGAPGRVGSIAIPLAQNSDLLAGIGAAVLLVVLLCTWIVPSKRAALGFTEAEVAFLFPAPIARQTLIHYKLLKLQLGGLLTILIFAFFSGPLSGGATFVERALAWWVLVTTVTLHALGASFARTWLVDRGVSRRRLRLLLAAIGVAAVGGIASWTWMAIPPPPPIELNPDPFTGWLRRVLDSGPLPWVLAPVRLVVAPIVPAPGSFLPALLPALLVVLLHYFWVLRANVAFEDATVEHAEKRGRQMAEARTSQSGGVAIRRRAQRDAFRLQPVGRPEMALTWKNLTQLGWAGRPRYLAWLLPGAAALAWCVTNFGPNGAHVLLFAIGCAGFGAVMVGGGQMLRIDLRQDLDNLDHIKSLPLTGQQVVLGQVLAPVWLATKATLVLAVLVIVSVRLSESMRDSGPPLAVAAVVGTLAVLSPLLHFLNVLLGNALLILFPAWHSVDPAQNHGFARMGQGLVLMLLQGVVMGIILFPATAVAGVTGFLLSQFLPPPLAWTVALAVAAILLATAGWFFLHLVGDDFAALDLSKEGLK